MSGAGATANALQEPMLLAMSQPREAAAILPAGVAATRDPLQRSVLLQAWGIALRELGDYGGAIRVLRRAVREGDRSGDADRAADARASLATALHLRGRSPEAVKVFEDALRLTGDPLTRAHIDVRLAAVLAEVGAIPDALGVYRRCIPVLRRSDDSVWLARAVGNRAFAYLKAGDVRRAEDGLVDAARMLEAAGQAQEAATRWHNLANLEVRRGHLPEALETYADVERRYRATGALPPELVSDRCRALLDAGMPADARRSAEAFLEGVTGRPDLPTADVLLLAAESALADDDPDAAAAHARRARRAFTSAGANHWARAARLVELRARYESGRKGAALARQADDLVTEMAHWRTSESSNARLFAVRAALAAGDRESASRHVRALSLRARTEPPLQRSHALLGRALVADHDDRSADVFRAARQGLALLDEHRASLGATELRAHATRHGAELAALAVEHAALHGTARDLLRWTERWRASLLDLPSVARDAERDTQLVADLAALRDVAHELRAASAERRTPAGLAKERRRLEERIRQRSLARRGEAGGAVSELDVPSLLADLGDRVLVSLVGPAGRVEVVVAAHGRVRRLSAGAVDAVRMAADHVLFALRSVAAGGPAAGYMLAALDDGLRGLEEVVLGPATRLLGDGPVVVVPPARLHSLPWDALPSMRDRAVTVAPSAGAWQRAAAATPPRRRQVALIGAPGLAHADEEVAALQRLHPDPVVLVGEAARAEPVLEALDGAWLGHVAAHGTYRGDNPLLSALEMADGPLTVYDLERLRRAPHRLVLSACESAVGSPTGADELLGLASALIGLGTAGVLASVVPVDDAATARLSVVVHERLASGASLAHALREARRRATEPVDVATAYAFLALGAG